MGAEIDRLEVQIEAQASDANKQLDKLTKNLEKVCGTLSEINSAGLKELSGGVKELGGAMQTFRAARPSDFTKIADGLMKFDKIPSGNLQNVSYAAEGLARSLGALKGVSFDASGLMNIASALAKLGTKTGNAGTENLSKIKTDLADFVSAMNSIESVTFDATGLLELTSCLAKLGGEKATQATRNLPAMSVYLKKFVSDLNDIEGVSFDVQGLSELVSSIAKLGGNASTKAIANIPNLAAAMESLITTLAGVPTVSRNTIQLVYSLAQLSAQGSKVSSAANSVNQSLTAMGNSAGGATKKAHSLASAFGKLYANLFWIKGISEKVWGAMESSMDFLETSNYFEVAMRDIGDSAAAQWRENGYQSAEAYAESFSERAKVLTEKMTGYSIDKDGNTTYSGVKNLGMDPDTVLQYQATYAQVSSSIGVAEESALNLSKALTMLGADWASLRNLSFDTAWEKFASALAGQSRAVRSLGIDITNATLQEYAYKNGLEQAVSEMNQATKAQLRLLAILDQSEVAYGDLANTIESPSNQIRMLQQNVSNLSRIFGNLFIPVLESTLPYINGVTIALQNLFSWLGNMLGIKFDSINSSMGGMSDEMYDLLDGAEGYEDALDGANAEAKKLRNNLQSWHEINNISTSDSTGGSSGSIGGATGGSELLDDAIAKALEDYETVWNDAFANMENKAQEFAERIGEYLEPLKKVIEDFSVGDYFAAGKDTSNLISGIFNFFADAIDAVDWYEIGQNIGDYLEGLNWMQILGSVGRVIWEALKGSLEVWSGMMDTAPVETILLTLGVMPNVLKKITASKFVTGIAKLTEKFKGLNKNFSGFLENLDSTGQVLTFNNGVKYLRNNMTGLQKGIVGATAAIGEFFLLKDGFYDLASGADDFVASIAEIAVGAGVASGALYIAFGPAGLAMAAITGVAAAICGINNAMDDIRAEEIGISIKNALSSPGGTPIGEITAQYANAISEIGDSFSLITEKSAGLSEADAQIRNTWLEIEKIETSMDAGVLSVEEGTAKLTELFGNLSDTAIEKFGILENTLLVAFGENGVLTGVFERLGISTENTIAMTLQLNEKAKQRIDELTKELATMDPTNPNYAAYKEELASLLTQTDDLTKAISDFEFSLENIDYSDLVGNDGNLDPDKLKEFLNELSSATKTANEDIDTAIKSLRQSLESELNMAETLGDWVAVEELQTKLDALPQVMELLKSDVAKKATELTDAVQIDLIGKLSEVIEDAEKEWGEKSSLEKALNGIFAASTEGQFVKEAADKQRGNIDTVSDAIEESLGELGINGAAWASGALEEIYNNLFDHRYTGRHEYTLNKQYKEVINKATEGLSELSEEKGQDATGGYESAFSDTESLQNAVRGYINAGLDEIAATQESHSPSKVTAGLGKDAVDGYNQGITENEESTLVVMGSFVDNVLLRLSGIIDSFSGIGQNAMAGLLDGMSSMENSLYAKANSIADNIVQTVQNALDIHSPSRVMFSLGEYTMEGYQLGMEELYSSVEKSVGGFYHDLQYYFDLQANPPQISGYTDYATHAAEYSSYSNENNYGTEETIMLLRELVNSNRELLAATRAGHVIEYNGRELGRVVQDEAIDYYKRNHVGMFDHR